VGGSRHAHATQVRARRRCRRSGGLPRRALAAGADRQSRRPAPGERRVSVATVEAELQRVKRLIADAELAWLFENCYPNVLDTAVPLGESDGKPDCFVVTGDIPALWLRDSSAQVWPYLPLARNDVTLQRLFRGLVHRQARCILVDPYAKALLQDLGARGPLEWAAHDDTVMKPGVAERKWEIDSLCHPIRLAHGYWRATGDARPFDSKWRAAMREVVRVFREQQRLDGPGPYRFRRRTDSPDDRLALNEYGAPTRKVGLIHSMFRPSDDACTYPFLVPANLFAVGSLRQLAAMVGAIHHDAPFAEECARLADQVDAAVARHGRIRLAGGAEVLAYEADGYGNALFIDDANIPGLLGLPCLGCITPGDPLYGRTPSPAAQRREPLFFRG
jgi:uncharacterized protein